MLCLYTPVGDSVFYLYYVYLLPLATPVSVHVMFMLCLFTTPFGRRAAPASGDRQGSCRIAWDRVRSRRIAWDRGSRRKSRGIACDRVESRRIAWIAWDRVGSRKRIAYDRMHYRSGQIPAPCDVQAVIHHLLPHQDNLRLCRITVLFKKPRPPWGPKGGDGKKVLGSETDNS